MSRFFMDFKFKKKYLIFLIIAVAVFFRFWQIGSVPPGLYPDVAVNGTDAISANENLNYQLFYPENNGREGLFINLIALSFKVFGTGLWQLRLVGVLIGVLTVLGVYLLTKELLGENTALFASVFAASSFWAVNFSRIGFRAIMVPFILVFAFYFLLKNIFKDKKPISDFIIAGVIFGLGFYTYISFRIAPLIAIILLAFLAIKNLKLLKKQWKMYVLFVLAALIIALPILIYFKVHSQDAVLRSGQISIFNPEVNKGNFIGTLIKTSSLAFGMFNFYGDPNWRHNFSGLPDLNIIVGIFFLVGIFLSLKNFIKGDLKESFTSLFLGSWLVVMLIPAILTEEGMPHSLRAIGAMVPVFIFAGIGAEALFNYFYKKNIKSTKVITIGLVSLILLSDFVLYFLIWAKRQEVIDQFTTRYVEEANYLNKTPESFNKYVIANESGVLVSGFPVQSQTIKFLTYNKSQVTFINLQDLERLKIRRPTILVALKNDEKIKSLLEKNQKVTESEVVTANKSIHFTTYFVE